MARAKALTPEQEALFPKPKPTQEYCDTCGGQAMFFFRDRETGAYEKHCSLHVPESFGIPKSLVREFEELFIQTLENNSTGSASNAPADISSSQ